MPLLSYNCLIKLKGTLRHSKKGGKRGIQMEGKMESSKVQKDNSQSFNSPVRERKMNKIRELRWRNSSHILKIIQNITQPPKKHMLKHAHIRYHFLPQNHRYLIILEGNAQAKLLGAEFQILQVLCKSTKSVRIGVRILVVNTFS